MSLLHAYSARQAVLEAKALNRPTWNPDLHPRDSKGRFIETGGLAKLWGGGEVRVLRALGGKMVLVQDTRGGKPSKTTANRLTMLSRPDGSKPTRSEAKVQKEDERRIVDPRRGDGRDTDDTGDDTTPDVRHNEDDEGQPIDADGAQPKRETVAEVKKRWQAADLERIDGEGDNDRAKRQGAAKRAAGRIESAQLVGDGDRMVGRLDGQWRVFDTHTGLMRSAAYPGKPEAIAEAESDGLNVGHGDGWSLPGLGGAPRANKKTTNSAVTVGTRRYTTGMAVRKHFGQSLPTSTPQTRRKALARLALDHRAAFEVTGDGNFAIVQVGSTYEVIPAGSGMDLDPQKLMVGKFGDMSEARDFAYRLAQIKGSNGEQIDWGAPELHDQMKSGLRSDRGENLARAALRVAAENDTERSRHATRAQKKHAELQERSTANPLASRRTTPSQRTPGEQAPAKAGTRPAGVPDSAEPVMGAPGFWIAVAGSGKSGKVYDADGKQIGIAFHLSDDPNASGLPEGNGRFGDMGGNETVAGGDNLQETAKNMAERHRERGDDRKGEKDKAARTQGATAGAEIPPDDARTDESNTSNEEGNAEADDQGEQAPEQSAATPADQTAQPAGTAPERSDENPSDTRDREPRSPRDLSNDDLESEINAAFRRFNDWNVEDEEQDVARARYEELTREDRRRKGKPLPDEIEDPDERRRALARRDQQQAEAEAKRHEKQAETARSRQEGAQGRADDAFGRFQGGQPILVGHSSERSARRARDRGDAAMRRAIEAGKEAEHHEQQARAARQRAEVAGWRASMEREFRQADFQPGDAIEYAWNGYAHSSVVKRANRTSITQEDSDRKIQYSRIVTRRRNGVTVHNPGELDREEGGSPQGGEPSRRDQPDAGLETSPAQQRDGGTNGEERETPAKERGEGSDESTQDRPEQRPAPEQTVEAQPRGANPRDMSEGEIEDELAALEPGLGEDLSPEAAARHAQLTTERAERRKRREARTSGQVGDGNWASMTREDFQEGQGGLFDDRPLRAAVPIPTDDDRTGTPSLFAEDPDEPEEPTSATPAPGAAAAALRADLPALPRDLQGNGGRERARYALVTRTLDALAGGGTVSGDPDEDWRRVAGQLNSLWQSGRGEWREQMHALHQRAAAEADTRPQADRSASRGTGPNGGELIYPWEARAGDWVIMPDSGPAGMFEHADMAMPGKDGVARTSVSVDQRHRFHKGHDNAQHMVAEGGMIERLPGDVEQARARERWEKERREWLRQQGTSQDRRNTASSSAEPAARERGATAPANPPSEASGRTPRFANVDEIRERLARGELGPESFPQTYARPILPEHLDNDSVELAPGGRLLIQDQWRGRLGSAQWGLSAPGSLEVLWESDSRDVINDVAEILHSVVDENGEPFPWDAPDVAERAQNFRGPGGLTLPETIAEKVLEADRNGDLADWPQKDRERDVWKSKEILAAAKQARAAYEDWRRTQEEAGYTVPVDLHDARPGDEVSALTAHRDGVTSFRGRIKGPFTVERANTQPLNVGGLLAAEADDATLSNDIVGTKTGPQVGVRTMNLPGLQLAMRRPRPDEARGPAAARSRDAEPTNLLGAEDRNAAAAIRSDLPAVEDVTRGSKSTLERGRYLFITDYLDRMAAGESVTGDPGEDWRRVAGQLIQLWSGSAAPGQRNAEHRERLYDLFERTQDESDRHPNENRPASRGTGPHGGDLIYPWEARAGDRIVVRPDGTAGYVRETGMALPNRDGKAEYTRVSADASKGSRRKFADYDLNVPTGGMVERLPDDSAPDQEAAPKRTSRREPASPAPEPEAPAAPAPEPAQDTEASGPDDAGDEPPAAQTGPAPASKWAEGVTIERNGDRLTVGNTGFGDHQLSGDELRSWMKDSDNGVGRFYYDGASKTWQYNKYGRQRNPDAARAEQALREKIAEIDARYNQDTDSDTAAPAKKGHPPTPQQQEIIDAVTDGDDVAVVARAGTGKTSTLKMVARALPPNTKIMYLAFNRSVAASARRDRAAGEFPRSMEARTANSLAMASTPEELKAKLKLPRQNNETRARLLGITGDLTLSPGQVISPENQARLVIGTINKWALSDDAEMAPDHMPSTQSYGNADRQEVFDRLKPLMDKAWADINDPRGTLRYNQDYAVKRWALSDPEIDADVIFWDEAQDINPVLEGVVRGQDAQVVIVGDPGQAIYGFRGTSNALDSFPVDRRLSLTQSWRFGPAVADLGNRFLGLAHEDPNLTGNPGMSTRIVDRMDAPDAVLTRTNAGVVAALQDAVRNNRVPAVSGGTDELERFITAARKLRDGQRVDHPDLADFPTWEAVQKYIAEEPDEAGSMAALVRLLDNDGAGEDELGQPTLSLDELLARVVDEKARHDVLISTAHKAKGGEWKKVRIGDDFKQPKRNKRGVIEELPDREEMLLNYVAVTRAMEEIDLGSLDWVFEASERENNETMSQWAARLRREHAEMAEYRRRRREEMANENFDGTPKDPAQWRQPDNDDQDRRSGEGQRDSSPAGDGSDESTEQGRETSEQPGDDDQEQDRDRRQRRADRGGGDLGRNRPGLPHLGLPDLDRHRDRDRDRDVDGDRPNPSADLAEQRERDTRDRSSGGEPGGRRPTRHHMSSDDWPADAVAESSEHATRGFPREAAAVRTEAQRMAPLAQYDTNLRHALDQIPDARDRQWLQQRAQTLRSLLASFGEAAAADLRSIFDAEDITADDRAGYPYSGALADRMQATRATNEEALRQGLDRYIDQSSNAAPEGLSSDTVRQFLQSLDGDYDRRDEGNYRPYDVIRRILDAAHAEVTRDGASPTPPAGSLPDSPAGQHRARIADRPGTGDAEAGPVGDTNTTADQVQLGDRISFTDPDTGRAVHGSSGFRERTGDGDGVVLPVHEDDGRIAAYRLPADHPIARNTDNMDRGTPAAAQPTPDSDPDGRRPAPEDARDERARAGGRQNEAIPAPRAERSAAQLGADGDARTGRDEALRPDGGSSGNDGTSHSGNGGTGSPGTGPRGQGELNDNASRSGGGGDQDVASEGELDPSAGTQGPDAGSEEDWSPQLPENLTDLTDDELADWFGLVGYDDTEGSPAQRILAEVTRRDDEDGKDQAIRNVMSDTAPITDAERQQEAEALDSAVSTTVSSYSPRERFEELDAVRREAAERYAEYHEVTQLAAQDHLRGGLGVTKAAWRRGGKVADWGYLLFRANDATYEKNASDDLKEFVNEKLGGQRPMSKTAYIQAHIQELYDNPERQAYMEQQKEARARAREEGRAARAAERAARTRDTDPAGPRAARARARDGAADQNASEQEAPTPEPVRGRNAQWVPTGDVATGDLVRVDGVDSSGKPVTADGHVAAQPQPVRVRRGRTSEPARAIVVTEQRDGSGDRHTVHVPENGEAARAPRPDDERPDGAQPQLADLDAREGRLADRVPTDPAGRALFPGSLVSDPEGRQGVITGTGTDTVSVHWDNDEVDPDVTPSAVNVVANDVARPAGWTRTGQQLRPGHAVSRPGDTDVLGVVMAVDGDEASVLTPEGERKLNAGDLEIVGRVAEFNPAGPLTTERTTMADLADGDIVLDGDGRALRVQGHPVRDGDRVSFSGRYMDGTDAGDYDGDAAHALDRITGTRGQAIDLPPTPAPRSPAEVDRPSAAPIEPARGRTVLPHLSPQERDAISDLGLDTDAGLNPHARQAALRLAADEQVTVKQARALADVLDAHAGPDTGRGRLLGRAALRLRDAARGRDYELAPPQRRDSNDDDYVLTPPRPTRNTVADLVPGDDIALPNGDHAEHAHVVGVEEGPSGMRRVITVDADGNAIIRDLPADTPVYHLPVPVSDRTPPSADEPGTDRGHRRGRATRHLARMAADITQAIADAAAGDGTEEPPSNLDELRQQVAARISPDQLSPRLAQAAARAARALDNEGITGPDRDRINQAGRQAAEQAHAAAVRAITRTLDDLEPLPGESPADTARRAAALLRRIPDAIDTRALAETAHRRSTPDGGRREQVRRRAARAVAGHTDRAVNRALADLQRAAESGELTDELIDQAVRRVQEAMGRDRAGTARRLAEQAPPAARRGLLARIMHLLAALPRKIAELLRRALESIKARWRRRSSGERTSILQRIRRRVRARAARTPEARRIAQALGEDRAAAAATNRWDRVAAHIRRLPAPGRFGQTARRVSWYRRARTEDLAAGRTPELDTTTRWVPDRASDGGPGPDTLRHLSAVNGVGTALDEELTDRMRTEAPELGDNPHETLRALRGYADVADRRVRHLTRPTSPVSEGRSTEEEDWEVTEALQEAVAARRELSQAESAYARATQSAARDALGRVRQLGPQGGARLRIDGDPNSPQVQAVRWAESFLPTDWLAQASGLLHVRAGDRGAYDPTSGDLTVADLGGDGRPTDGWGASALHGLGHHLQHSIPELARAEAAYHFTRTSEGPVGGRRRTGRNLAALLAELFPGRGAAPGQYTREDSWPDAWTGLEPADGRSWEVLPMALESLFAGSWYLDDDLRKFLLGVLGSLGTRP